MREGFKYYKRGQGKNVDGGQWRGQDGGTGAGKGKKKERGEKGRRFFYIRKHVKAESDTRGEQTGRRRRANEQKSNEKGRPAIGRTG